MGKAKLTNEQIDEIKKLYVPSKGGNRKGNNRTCLEGSMSWLAQKYGVSIRVIFTVIHGLRKRNMTRMERFMTHIHKTDTCWLWTGCKDPDGYGDFGWSTADKSTGAHRASYVLFKGDIPEGLMVLHSCDNPPCVNPEHLFVGTGRDNIDDMVTKGRSLKGERNYWSAFTQEQANDIRKRYVPTIRIPNTRPEYNPNSIRSIAKEFGVSKRVIRNIIQNKSYC